MALDPNEGCTTPNELFPIEAERQAIEREIERVIIGDFRGSTAAVGAIDIFIDPAIGGPRALTDWLSAFSFGQTLNKTRMMQGFDAGDYAVPDFITFRATLAKSEYYEIKPNSANGPGDGAAELLRFARLNKDFHLLYFPGMEYDPNASNALRSTHLIGATEYELRLTWWRSAPGLILYEICYKVKKKVEVKERVPIAEIALAVLLALLLLIMLRGARSGSGGGALNPPLTA